MPPALALLIFAGLTSIGENICKASPVIAPTITNAPNNAYPFVVSIQLKLVHYCGGSLITRKHILTAAHCFDRKYHINNYRVLVGSNDLRRANVYYIKSWLTYDDWAINKNIMAKYQENDIAIVELISSLYGAGINLAKITSALDDELRDQQVLSAGWGELSDGSTPRYMVEVHLTVISRETCLRNIRNARQIPTDKPDTLHENIFCTNGDPYAVLFCYLSNLCVCECEKKTEKIIDCEVSTENDLQGDSGSPVFWKGNEIIGINQSICPFAQNETLVTTKEQNLHVDVRLYLDFISPVNDNCTIKKSASVSRCWIM